MHIFECTVKKNSQTGKKYFIVKEGVAVPILFFLKVLQIKLKNLVKEFDVNLQAYSLNVSEVWPMVSVFPRYDLGKKLGKSLNVLYTFTGFGFF